MTTATFYGKIFSDFDGSLDAFWPKRLKERDDMDETTKHWNMDEKEAMTMINAHQLAEIRHQEVREIAHADCFMIYALNEGDWLITADGDAMNRRWEIIIRIPIIERNNESFSPDSITPFSDILTHKILFFHSRHVSTV